MQVTEACTEVGKNVSQCSNLAFVCRSVCVPIWVKLIGWAHLKVTDNAAKLTGPWAHTTVPMPVSHAHWTIKTPQNLWFSWSYWIAKQALFAIQPQSVKSGQFVRRMKKVALILEAPLQTAGWYLEKYS